MARPALVLFSCIVTFSLSLLPCASLSQDGVILLKMKKEYCSDTEALNDWNESDQNPCAWSRISCDTFNCVTKVNLSGSFISGNLTSALCSLPNLTTLILSYNEFGGPFPDGLLHCKSLRQLDLSSNQFVGRLPSNSFSGPLPEGLFLCKLLRQLDLKSNKFSGTLPISIYELSDLRELYLAGCPVVSPN
ncbi:receptor-like protein 52 [Cryptomeria japonica]|uniref:receptor-like protein 52 n=1 Tax=Cryptomeria japonica TaxID=3369 RepID=UPI0027DA4C97|nr:receptor-like protein 52 [Cryptomeria japonica]